MFLKKADLITYSAPMMKGDFGAEKRDDYTINSFFIALNNEKQVLDGQIIYDGTSKGVLWGGNLASLVSLCGVDFIPDREFIFFAEDLNEPVYKIDKMLTQLFNIEKFRKNIKGMAFGQFLDCGCPEQLEFLFKEIANEYDDFNKGITEDSKEFKKNNINEILECLSKGYNGCLVLETYGRISYDKDIQKFIFTKESTGQQVELDDEKLNKVIQLAIEHNINHYGEARKTINK